MTRYHMGFCQCGGLAAIAVADSAEDLVRSSKEAKQWEKQGMTVDLKESPPDTPLPAWCDKATCPGPQPTR